MPNLRDQMQIARINRMKRRAAIAWHLRTCPGCAAQRAAAAAEPTLTRISGSLVDFLRIIDALPMAVDDEPAPPAKHTH